MSVREEVRRALAPDSAVDKALDVLERIISKDGQGPAQAYTAFDLGVTERDDLQMMDRLRDSGFVIRQSLNHQVAYRVTDVGRKLYQISRPSPSPTKDHRENAIAPGEW